MNEQHEKQLKEIGFLIETQSNRLTDQPMFIVQEQVIDYGYSPEYSDDYVWIDHSNEDLPEADEETAEKLDEIDEEGDVFGDGAFWEKVYYQTRWEFITACFTEKGCQDFINADGHNHGELRIYAVGSFRNNEFRRVRKALIEMNKK